ncbi:MAG: hypothetical protein QF926_07075 [Alphaproteobacteria bacterium]|jgi:DNA-binding CsgD family transcriptional regulator|nr:hypothetical protein [Alphaproteobacteria bacterium]MDP6516367.1 hypothetical protein [Alphaproteobacteria bacterium]
MAAEDAGRGTSALIGAIYDAALADGPVPRFLEALATNLSEHGIALVIREEFDPRDPGPDPGPESRSAVPVAEAAGRGALDDGELITEAAPAAGADQLASVTLGYFQGAEPARRAELIIRFADAETARRHGGQGRAQGRASGQIVSMVDLAAHVGRAVTLHRTVLGRRVQWAAANRLLDAVPVGIALVDSACRVLHANRMAEIILTERDGLGLDRGLLTTPQPKDTTRLRRAVVQVAGAGDGPERTPVGVLRIERPSMMRPWLLVVLPVDVGGPEEGISRMAAVFVADGDRAPEIPPEVLERLFAVTPAEARLLVALVDGNSLDEAAEMFQVSKNTLRNQLNQLFRKTETSKQSELVRLVLTSPAPVLMSGTRKSES